MEVRVYRSLQGGYGKLYLSRYRILVSITSDIQVKCERSPEIIPEVLGMVEVASRELPNDMIDEFRELMREQEQLEALREEAERRENELRGPVFMLLK